jgi:hypothetical protein
LRKVSKDSVNAVLNLGLNMYIFRCSVSPVTLKNNCFVVGIVWCFELAYISKKPLQKKSMGYVAVIVVCLPLLL